MNIVKTFVLTFVLGTISNYFGGILGFKMNTNEKNIKKTTSFAAGITTTIICFELLKEAFDISDKYKVVFFIIIGVVFIKILDIIINLINKGTNNQSKLVVSAMSAHNITEGLAIGSAFGVSKDLGLSLLVGIMIHNIPEGMIIGNMTKKGGGYNSSVFRSCITIGGFLGMGAIIGFLLGNIGDTYVMPSLAISAGAMLYIVAYELIPEINNNNSYNTSINYIAGFLIGCLMCKL